MRDLIEPLLNERLRRIDPPPEMRATLRLYTWATGRPHVVVLGTSTGRLDVLPVDWRADEAAAERWATAIEREVLATARATEE